MKKSINVLGAFDRYNYGDLLFPIIIEEYLKKFQSEILEEYDINYYGLIESDLSYVGGKKTKSLKQLYKNAMPEDSVVIVAGGEVLGSPNRGLYLDLCDYYVESFLKKYFIALAKRIVGEKTINAYFRNYFGVKSDYPWIIEQNHFKNNVHIIYNTVGGRLPNTNSQYYHEQLKSATYISIREKDAKDRIGVESARLAPDSASIMSLFFTEARLLTLISDKVKNFVDNNSKFICIQTNQNLYSKNKSEFIRQIRLITESTQKVEVLLLPIGFATNHDDVVALKSIKSKIPDVHLIEDLNIYDIMYLIAKSNFFVGSSLHGNITAMSYCVPHIGIGKKPKLDSYLNNWDIEEQSHCIEINQISEYFEKLTKLDNRKLVIKKNEIENLVLENFGNLINSFFKD